MRKTSRFIGLLALLVFLAGFLTWGVTGCAKKTTGTRIKISSWGDLQENSILVNMVAGFEKKFPNIKVELLRIPYAEYVTKLLTQVAAGMAPDVIFVEVGNFVDLYLRDALVSLNPYIQADQFNLGAYYPEVVDRFTVDGQSYVIPRDTAPICVIYYNKKAFDEARVPYPTDDWDWSQFILTCQKLVKKDAAGKVTRWAFIDDWTMIDPWIYSAGGRWVDDVKRPKKWVLAEDPNFVRGIQFRADLMYKYKVMPAPSSLTAMGGMGTSDMFMNGTVAMFLSGIWKTPRFRDIKNFDWDIVMFPKGPTGIRAFSTGGSGYGILKTSKYKKEAWQLVKYISGEEGARQLAATGLAQPAIVAVAESPAFLDGQKPLNKKMLLEAVKYVKYSPMAKNAAEVTNGIVVPQLDRVWSNTATAVQAAAALKPLLARNPPQVK
jgi:ABC-type glycerol-3-phosphate transport system substrate-binding protein